jgi:hypothetical protein
LAALVQAIFDESDGTYGYRRVHAALARQDEDCDPELVRDITPPPSCSTSLEPKQDQTGVGPVAIPRSPHPKSWIHNRVSQRPYGADFRYGPWVWILGTVGCRRPNKTSPGRSTR